MGMMRYTFDYNGMRYTVDAPEGTSPADLQRAVSKGSAPAASREQPAQAEFRKKREEERGVIGKFVDRLFGSDVEVPRPYSAAEIGQRQTDIGTEQQKLLAKAARYDQLAKATGEDVVPGSPEDLSLRGMRQAAEDARRQAAALGAESKRIAETGMPVPKVQYTREMAGAAPRQFLAGTAGLPGEAINLVGRGLGAVEEATGVKLGAKQTKAAGRAWNEAVQRGAEVVFGAPGEALQYDRSGQIATDVAGGAGSLATFAVPGVAAKLAGVGKGLVGTERAARIAQASRPFEYGIAAGQGLQQGRQDIEDYEKRTGKQVSDASAFGSLLVNAGLGLSEVGVLNRVFGRLPLAQREAAMGRIDRLVNRVTRGNITSAEVRPQIRQVLDDIERSVPGGKVLVAGGTEAAQEMGTQFGTNLAAKVFYDPDRDLSENVAYSGLIGGIVGSGVRGSVDLRRALGQRAANNRQKAFEQLGGEGDILQEFDINVGSEEDPSQLVRQRVQILSPADQNGNVLVARPDGTRYQASLAELERMRAPTEGIRAIAIPDTLSRPVIAERLTTALGSTAPDEDMASYIKNVTTTLNNNMAMGTPEATETFLQRQQNSLRKSRIPEEARIARMLVLDEAAKVHGDYLNLVTAPPEGAAPVAVTEPVAPPPPLVETLAARVADVAEAREQRAHLMNGIIGSTDIIDKPGAFADALTSAGMSPPSAVETAVLRDAMRLESEAETAAGQEKDTRDRQRIVERMNIIEPVLFDDRIPPEKKAERINVKLRKQGFKPLNRFELERMAGFEAANAVFGPEGEYTQRRQAILDQVLADPTIVDKYRGYAEALDQFPELGDPTPEEIRALRGDAAALEAQIAPSGEAVPETQLPAEPGALPAEFTQEAVAEAPAAPVEEEVPAPVAEEVPVAEEAAPEPEPVPQVDPEEVLRDVDEPAIADAQRQGHDPNTFLAGVDDVRRSVTPLSIQGFGEEFGFVEPGEKLKFSLQPRPVDQAYAAYKAGVEWAANRVAEATPTATPRAAPVVEQAAPEPAPVEEAAPEAAPEQPALTAATQTINNPEEDIAPVEEQLQADPETIEGAFPASTSRPRAEAIGFAADLEQRVKRMSSRFIRKISNKYQTAADYSQALAASYGLTNLPSDLNVARKFELLDSRKIGGQMRLNRWYLQPIEDKIKELGLDPKDVAVYLWARSAPGRNALVSKRNGVENGSGLSDAEAQAKLDQFELEGLGPDLREVAKLHDALVDYIGAQRVKAGLLSRDDWKAMRKEQPFYTPLKGYALAGDMQVDGDPDPHGDEERGIASRNGTRVREVITARGRESMPFSPLFNLMSDAQFAIARIEQNKVKTAFLNNVLSDPKSHEGLVKVYTPKKEKHASGLVTLPKLGPNGPVNMNQIAAQKNPELMVVKKDGKPYFIEFARTPAGNALYRAFANMTPTELGKFMRAATTVSNTIKSFKTRYNPIYIGSTAWMRDFNEAILTAYAAQGIKGGPAAGTKLGKKTARYIASLSGMGAITDYLRGKAPTTAEGEIMTLLFDQFLEDGGAVGHAQIMDAETYAQDAAKSIERYAAAKRGSPKAAALMAKDMTAKALDDASQLIDLQARFATYRAALEEGISREDAASLALDSSLNLTRRGEWAPYLDIWSFFASPTIEGTRKLLSQGRYSTIARKLFTKTVAMGALLYLFNRFGPGAGDDDEDKRPNILEVNNATAQSRLILRYGPGVNDYVSVPVAFSMGFFNYMGGQLMAAALGDLSPEEAGVNIVSGFTDMASPIKTEGTEGLTSIVNFAIPDPVQPLWDVVVNRNAFGARIYTPQEYRTTPKSELSREETGEVWKFIARGINSLFGGTGTVESWASFQPEGYRYIVSQLLGGAYGVGRDTVALFTDEAKPGQTAADRIPLIKTFMGKGGEYAPMNKFYEDYDRLKAIYAVYNDDNRNAAEWAENKASFPTQSSNRVMDAFGDAQSELRKIDNDYKDGQYQSRDAMLNAKTEVFKKFNRIYADAKRAD